MKRLPNKVYASDIQHPNLQDKLEQLYTLNRDKKIDLSFRPPYLALLEKLGNPHLNLPPTIHVAGTNGKGSTIAILRSILETAGYRVHTYTSPHLIRFNERIVLAGHEISDEALEPLIDEALSLNNGGDLTFFEITTAIAFKAFADTPADICLLEVGMGGRLDCTNVIENPIATAITPIGIDHAEHLGESVQKIAAEKAGIIKKNVPCIIAKQSHENAYSVIEGIAKHKAAPVIRTQTNPKMHALEGAHQAINTATALETLNQIKDQFPAQQDHIDQGLKNAQWRARLQKLDATKFGLTPSTCLYLDGGHNEDAGKALALWLKNQPQPRSVILGMMKGKDAKSFFKPIKPHCEDLILTAIDNEPQSQGPSDLQTILEHGRIEHSFQDALKSAQGKTILIAGSLYLAGRVLQHSPK